MSDNPQPADHPPRDDLSRRLDQFEQSLAAVGRDIESLRDQISETVRTRRLVIVEGDGFERVILGGANGFGHLTIHARTDGRGSVAVEMFAADPVDGEPSHIGLALIDNGDVVAAVDVQSGRPAMVWTPSGATRHESGTDPG